MSRRRPLLKSVGEHPDAPLWFADDREATLTAADFLPRNHSLSALAKAARKSVLAISGVSRQGVDDALTKVLTQVQRARRECHADAEAAATPAMG